MAAPRGYVKNALQLLQHKANVYAVLSGLLLLHSLLLNTGIACFLRMHVLIRPHLNHLLVHTRLANIDVGVPAL